MWAARNKGSGDRLDLEKFPRGAVPLEVSNGLLKFRCDRTWLLVVIVSRVFFCSVNKILSVERLPCVLSSGNPHMVPVSLTLTGAVPMGYTGCDKVLWTAHPKSESQAETQRRGCKSVSPIYTH